MTHEQVQRIVAPTLDQLLAHMTRFGPDDAILASANHLPDAEQDVLRVALRKERKNPKWRKPRNTRRKK